MTLSKVLMSIILLTSCLGLGGCASLNNDAPFQEGVDYVGLEEGQEFKAPVRGAFLSDEWYAFQFERCEQ